MTRDLPKVEGYYWFCNFGEHTPTIVEVTREGEQLWAHNEEFSFVIKHQDLRKIVKESRELGLNKTDGFYYGEELWCYIPNPFLPGGETQIEPDSY